MMELGQLNTDTIAAIATAPGRGGVGIVRVSGPKSKEIATSMLGFFAQTPLCPLLSV